MSQEDRIRGAEFQQLLDSPQFKEMWQVPKDRIVSRLEQSGISEDERRTLNYLLQAFRLAKSYAERAAETGRLESMAEVEEQKKRTIADRFLRRA